MWRDSLDAIPRRSWIPITAVALLLSGGIAGGVAVAEEDDFFANDESLFESAADDESSFGGFDEEAGDVQESLDELGQIGESGDQIPPSGEVALPATFPVEDLIFSDVQVSEDFAGDFQLRARVTNDGESVPFAEIEATLFYEGAVVAELNTFESLESGETRTTTFTGLEDAGPWDEVEFAVDP